MWWSSRATGKQQGSRFSEKKAQPVCTTNSLLPSLFQMDSRRPFCSAWQITGHRPPITGRPGRQGVCLGARRQSDDCCSDRPTDLPQSAHGTTPACQPRPTSCCCLARRHSPLRCAGGTLLRLARRSHVACTCDNAHNLQFNAQRSSHAASRTDHDGLQHLQFQQRDQHMRRSIAALACGSAFDANNLATSPWPVSNQDRYARIVGTKKNR